MRITIFVNLITSPHAVYIVNSSTWKFCFLFLHAFTSSRPLPESSERTIFITALPRFITASRSISPVSGFITLLSSYSSAIVSTSCWSTMWLSTVSSSVSGREYARMPYM